MSRVNDVCLATKTSSYFASCTDLNLDAKENLLDGDGRAPVLLLVQDGEADLQQEIDGSATLSQARRETESFHEHWSIPCHWGRHLGGREGAQT